MKGVSKNWAASLRGQSEGGRSSLNISTGRLKANSPGMVVPGEGRVQAAAGTGRSMADNDDGRSARHYADALGRRVY